MNKALSPKAARPRTKSRPLRYNKLGWETVDEQKDRPNYFEGWLEL